MHLILTSTQLKTLMGFTSFLKEVGIPVEDDVMKPNDTYVFSFPVKAPEGAIVRNDLTALDHLN